jgi:hypothetical protein
MLNIKEFIGILIVIIIILIFYSRILEYKQLTGFWKASNDYCKSANLELFLIYFSPGYYKRNVYILIKSEDGVIVNDMAEIDLIPSITTIFNPIINKEFKYNINIKWINENEIDNEDFPSEQELILYPYDNKLILNNDDKIFAILYKDNIMSDIK